MAKLSQADVKAKADEVVKIDRQIAKLEDKRGEELQPFLEKLERDTKAINESYDKKIAQLRSKRADIEGEVIAHLNGIGKPIVLEGELAVAANEKVIGKRVIPPATFFEKVKQRTVPFWECVTIGIAKAEKLIGATAVDEISSKETKLVASIKAK